MSLLKRLRDIVRKQSKSDSIEQPHKPEKQPAVINEAPEPRQKKRHGSIKESELAADCESLERMKALTPREWEVYEHLIRAMKMREIAELLGVSYPTVNFHCRGLYKKLGINTRAQLFTQYLILDANDVKKARESEK